MKRLPEKWVCSWGEKDCRKAKKKKDVPFWPYQGVYCRDGHCRWQQCSHPEIIDEKKIGLKGGVKQGRQRGYKRKKQYFEIWIVVQCRNRGSTSTSRTILQRTVSLKFSVAAQTKVKQHHTTEEEMSRKQSKDESIIFITVLFVTLKWLHRHDDDDDDVAIPANVSTKTTTKTINQSLTLIRSLPRAAIPEIIIYINEYNPARDRER